MTELDRDFPEGADVSRVTIDVDGYHHGWRMKAIRCYHNLFAEGAHTVDVSISSSGRGIHLVGWFDRFIDDEAELEMRRRIGDDSNRVAMDEERGRVGHVTGVLWDDKATRDGSSDHDFADIYDALDHVDLTNRSDAERIHDVANYGHRAATEPARLNRIGEHL